MKTVGQLIKELEKYPKSRPVVVRGYEGGFDNPKITETKVLFNTNWEDGDDDDDNGKIQWYVGRHSETEKGGHGSIALLIDRYDK
jgi:hypothetical protein